MMRLSEDSVAWVPGRQGASIKWSTQRIERLAIFLDLENLVHEHRVEEDWEGAASMLRDAVGRFDERGIRVLQIAACDAQLSHELSDALKALQFDTVVHGGGSDRADYVLLDQIRRTPTDTFDTLVIGSGDDIFAAVAADSVEDGKTVEVIAIQGRIGGSLYRSAHCFHPLPARTVPRKLNYPLDHLPVGLAYGGALPFALLRRYRPYG